MDTLSIRSAVERLTGGSPVSHTPEDLAALPFVDLSGDLAQYLLHCLPRETYEASGVRVLPLDRIMEESFHLSPGAHLRPFGFVPIASSIGGNIVVASTLPSTQAVYWADHSGWAKDSIMYRDRQSGDWLELLGVTPEHVLQALAPLEHSLEAFLLPLLKDDLTATLDALD